MDERSKRELVSSIHGLYNSSKFSDLVVKSRAREYHAHQAVVCPRSKYFAAECLKVASQAVEHARVTLNLSEDDPRAVEMVLRYLYHLDYPSVLDDDAAFDDEVLPNGTHLTNGHDAAHAVTNGVNGTADDASIPEVRSPAPEEPAAEDLEEFLPPSSLPKKKKGRKKRAKSIAPLPDGEDAQPEAARTETPEPAPAVEPSAEQRTYPEPEPEPAQKPKSADPAAELPIRPAEKPEEDTPEVPEPPPSQGLTAHARVFALAEKYGIDSLRWRALEKFETEASAYWETDDFLLAAKEVYDARAGAEDKSMRNIVTAVICQHPELMDKERAQALMLGQLAVDVLKRVREQGGFFM